MTAPTIVPDSALPDGPIPDDILGAALTAAAERNSRFAPDAPADAPPETPAAPATDAGPAGDAPAVDPDAPATPDGTAVTPEGEVPVEDPFADLLATGNPFAYKVDGTSKTFDGIVEVAGKGAFIKPDALDRVRDTIQRAEHATEANRALYAQVQSFEQVGGVAKLHELTEQNAALNVIIKTMAEGMDNLDQFLIPNGAGGVMVDERARNIFFRELVNAGKEARAQAASTRQQAEVQATTAQQDEARTAQGIRAAIDTLADGLTDADKAEAESFFGRFATSLVKQATPDVAQQFGLKVGERYVDRALMVDWFEARRAQRTRERTESEARTKAERENRTRVPAPKAVTPPKPKAVPRNEDGTFAEAPRKKWQPVDRSVILDRALAGKPVSGKPSYDEE